MNLAKRLNIFGEYAFFTLAKKKADVEKTSGRKVLDLSIGSPDFPPSSIYINKLKEFFAEKNSHIYPGYGPILEFTQGLRNWYKKRFDVDLEKNELFPLLGGKDGVSHLALTLLDTGDEVLVPDPGYPAFSGPPTLIGATPVFYNLTETSNFKINFNELKKKISNKTKFIWVNFPANPTGQVVDINDLEQIINFVKKNNIWLVYDNAYSEITFDEFVAPSILQIEGAKDVAVEIGSFSKTFSFAGYRMGWIVGNKEIISALSKVKSQFDSGLSRPLQKLGAFALNNNDEKWHRTMITSYEKRRNIIIKNLKKIGLTAEKTKGSLYLWVKIPDHFKDSQEFSFELLEKKQILLAPGTVFGKNGKRYVRVSICANINGIERHFN
ncbi:MAG: aminotransferase [Candidatus Roizmanbacteria bacterium GW2011_GWC2_37_13]|uniref:Aminotransferase n=1 Tax=Candidatus Roizmanbacteria bacterium GW2011_GWC2_37_13 TaxID=1618486 RepID=A0A0G0JAB9_9BACT|nr:MAG: aminotransferase [Candidatus Roizmanbacteria bacterium GW2011_GWC1_37_12]KKQ25146.1 MAG: aminotransferase [Candidatus Roizmanbacteria bacterium GW2011_GWC2_37_13]